MSQANHQPNSRPRRGGRPSQNRNRQQNRSGGPRGQPSGRPDRHDRVGREDHRDWEPVDRGRDIRRRDAAKPATLLERILHVLTFGRLGKKAAVKSKKLIPQPPPQPQPGRQDAPARSARPVRDERPGDRERPENRENRTPRERPVMPPDPAAVTSPRLHVGNLSYDAAESDLIGLFNGAGQVQSAEVVYHRDTQRSKGFAFVQMLTIDEARRAVSELHGKDFMGRKLEIGPARSTGERPSRDRS